MQSFVALRCILRNSLRDFFRELITTTRRTTRVAFWDPPSGSKNGVFDDFPKSNCNILYYTFKVYSSFAVQAVVWLNGSIFPQKSVSIM